MPNDLRAATIRLAHERPHLRAALLPLLERVAEGPPSYEGYVKRKRTEGKRPLSRKRWEALVLRDRKEPEPKGEEESEEESGSEDKPKPKSKPQPKEKPEPKKPESEKPESKGKEEAPEAGKFEGFVAKLKEKAKGLRKEVLTQLEKASDEVKAFVSDPDHRKKRMSEAATKLRKTPKATAKKVREAAVDYIHEHTKALRAVGKMAKGQKLDKHDKHALFHAGVTIAMGAIGASAGGLPGAAGAIGKAFGKYVIANAMHKMVGKASTAHEVGEVAHHIGEGILEFFSFGAHAASDHLKIAADPSEDDAISMFSNLIVAAVIKALEGGLSDDDVVSALGDETPEDAAAYGSPEDEGTDKEASLRAATIRLAAMHPDMRTALLEVLK